MYTGNLPISWLLLILVAVLHSLRRLKIKAKNKRLPIVYVTFYRMDTSGMSLNGTIAG